MKRRARIAYRNLELCFPQMSESERHDMVVKNFESVGMGLMETGMAWFWSDKRMARWTEVAGPAWSQCILFRPTRLASC